MTVPMDAKLCRESYDRYCSEHGEKDDPFDWHVWQYAWDARALATPSPEVDEASDAVNYAMVRFHIAKVLVSNGILSKTLAKDIQDAIRPYLAQGAVRVDLEKCGAALKPFIGNKNYNEEAAKAVILSLKQQNPGVQFDEQ